MRPKFVIASALAACGFSGASAAAPEKSAPLIPDWKQSHFEEGNPAIRAVYFLAMCAKLQRRQAAEALLATDPGSAEEAALVEVLMPAGFTDCPIRARKVTIRSRILIRGAIAEALYKGDGFRPRSTSALPLDQAFQPAGRGSATAVGRWVARCAVRREPLRAHSVVSYNPGAVGEMRALRSLKPTFIACLPPGERLLVSRINFRALVAEELYRASVSFKGSFANGRD